MRTVLDPTRIHAGLIKSGATDRALYNNLITLYSKTPSKLPNALLLFRRLPFQPTPVSWTAIVSAHSHSPSASLSLFLSMLRSSSSLPINQGTLSSLLKTLSSASPSLFSTALQLHSLSLKLALSSLPFSGCALVHFYANFRLPSDALKAFDEILHKDQVCYSAAIVGLSQNKRPIDALSLFKLMRSDGIRSTMYSISGALRAAAHLAALEQSRLLHAHAVVAGFELNFVVGTALVDAYGKSGLVSDARKIFDGMTHDSNLVTWNAMLGAYAQQGDASSAQQLFDEMLGRNHFRPDKLTFLAVLTAFSNAGLVEETERWIESMGSCYGIEPGVEHYTCLIGAMVRVGRLEEAERVAVEMPFEADAAVWRTVLLGCVVHGLVELGLSVGRRLLEVEPGDDLGYVMVANLCSSAGRKEERERVWSLMRERGVRKEWGRSWIEVRGEDADSNFSEDLVRN